MFSKEEILKKLHEHKDEMRIRFSVSQIGLSGSYVHDAPREGSDIDRLLRLGNSRQGCESNGVKVPCCQLPDSDS